MRFRNLTVKVYTYCQRWRYEEKNRLASDDSLGKMGDERFNITPRKCQTYFMAMKLEI
jgi:hypothetical protein